MMGDADDDLEYRKPEPEQSTPQDYSQKEALPAALDVSKLAQVAQQLDWQSLQICLAFFSFITMVATLRVAGYKQDIASGFNITIPTDVSPFMQYQISIGAISFTCAFVTVVLGLRGWDPYVYKLIMSGFQFLWWDAGVIALTFFGSFQTTSIANGYFGAWLSFFFSSLILMSVSPAFEHHMDKAVTSTRKPLLFLITTSSIVLGASISPCTPPMACTNFNAFAVSLSTISLILALFMFLGAKIIPPKRVSMLTKLLVVWWTIGTLVVTFGGPFESTGNGYFATYGAFMASVGVLQTTSKNAVMETKGGADGELEGEMHI